MSMQSAEGAGGCAPWIFIHDKVEGGLRVLFFPLPPPPEMFLPKSMCILLS